MVTISEVTERSEERKWDKFRNGKGTGRRAERGSGEG